MKYKLLNLILIFLLSVSFTLAAGYPLDLTLDKRLVTESGGIIQANIGIQNNGPENIVVLFNSDPYITLPSSQFDSSIISLSRVHLAPYSRKEIIVTLKMKDSARINEKYATYIEASILERPDFKKRLPLVVTISPPEFILEMSTSVPDKITPGENLIFDVTLENKLDTLLPSVKISVDSDLFNEVREFKLFAKQDRPERFIIKIPDLTPPGEHKIDIKAYSQNELITSSTSVFTILENLDVKESKEFIDKLFKKTYIMRKTNHGNSEVKENFVISLSRFQQFFMDYNVEPTGINEDKVYWEFFLLPTQSKQIEVYINYWPLSLSILVFIALLIIIPIMLSKKVTIKKEILKVSEQKDGTVKLKVLLHVKNNTRKTISNFTVIDFLPKLIHPEIGYGTIKPDKVQKSSKGIKLKWGLEKLVSGEERIISYQIKSKLSIIGRIMLPPAMVKYWGKNRKVVRRKSKKLGFNIGA